MGVDRNDAQWQIWYQDMFDHECPRRVEVEGRGLAAGLAELWSRHLYETVLPDGRRGFSRFNLWWTEEGRSVQVVGDWGAMSRVRGWVYGDQAGARRRYARGGKALLARIAALHARLAIDGQTSEAILAAAGAAADRAEFERRLAQMDVAGG